MSLSLSGLLALHAGPHEGLWVHLGPWHLPAAAVAGAGAVALALWLRRRSRRSSRPGRRLP